MAITINGSGTVTGITAGGLPDGCVDNDTIADSTIANAKLVNDSVTVNGTSIDLGASDTITAGKILQVVSTRVANDFTVTTGSTQADITGLSVSITPSSTSSKIMVFYKINFSNPNGYGCTFHLHRNGSEIQQAGSDTGIEAFASGNIENSDNNWSLDNSGSVLDSPASTSALTYKFKVRGVSNSQTHYFNRTGRKTSEDALCPSTITVMEIAG